MIFPTHVGSRQRYARAARAASAIG